MAVPSSSVEQQLRQLGDARKLVLGDASYYPQIITGILPIIGPNALLELRRWGADFIAETFASPNLAADKKEAMCLEVLETMQGWIGNPREDAAVVKNTVQAAASVYPLVFRWMINNPYDTTPWDRMMAIKSRIFQLWDSSVPGVRMCCIKFAQRVILVQTPGPAADSRRGSAYDVSLALIPQTHIVLTSRNLEAEASGLLDRMLAVFHENTSDAVLIDATLNSLATLIRARPNLANKIINVILNFNPLKLANSPMTPKLRVMVKSMEKTTRMLLVHILKHDPQHQLAGRIHQYVERNMRSKMEIFDEAIKKRGPPEPTDGLDAAKRQKLGAQIPAARINVPPLTPGSHTLAELYTVTGDEALKRFDVGQLPEDLVVKIAITILQKLNTNALDQTIAGIRARYTSFETAKPEELNPATAILGVEDDEDDYEPDFYPSGEDTAQILNKLENDQPPEETKLPPPDLALGPFTLPPPPPLTPEQTIQVGEQTITRIFGVMQTLEDPPTKKVKAGINRLAASTYDCDAWITIVTRLATRSIAGLEDSQPMKDEPDAVQKPSLNNTIREALYLYILEDFRKRIDIAVAWLCEEWYNDRVTRLSQSPSTSLPAPHYEYWVLRVLDGIMPYLDAKDKILTRFLSEIPSVSREVLGRVKTLCRDPAMVNLALTSLLYLVMLKPPVREEALDAVEGIWGEYEDAKPMAIKYLTKWRPGFAERIKQAEEGKEEKEANGMDVVAEA